MTDVKIRLLQKDHLNEYRNLRLKSFKNSPYAFSESYDDEKTRPLNEFDQELEIEGDPPEQFILGAFNKESQLIGFVKFRRDKRSKARHKSMLHAMYVEPEYRNYGVGGKILEETINKAKQIIGLEQIHLWVLHSNNSKSASKFYSNYGFISQGTKVKKDLKIGENYIDAEYMVLYF